MRLSMNGDVTLNTIRLNKLGRNNFPTVSYTHLTLPTMIGV